MAQPCSRAQAMHLHSGSQCRAQWQSTSDAFAQWDRPVAEHSGTTQAMYLHTQWHKKSHSLVSGTSRLFTVLFCNSLLNQNTPMYSNVFLQCTPMHSHAPESYNASSTKLLCRILLLSSTSDSSLHFSAILC